MNLPDDPYLRQYPEEFNQWGLFAIHAPEAWRITKGDPSIVIAVAEAGVDISHPDLAANIWTNPDPGRSGFPGDVHGWDFIDNDASVEDDPESPAYTGCYDHGTHVAGIAAAVAGNHIGIAGVAPQSRIMPIRINGNEPSQIVKAIRYAVENGARVINVNGGFYPPLAMEHRDDRYQDIAMLPSSELEDAIAWLLRQAAIRDGGNSAQRQPVLTPSPSIPVIRHSTRVRFVFGAKLLTLPPQAESEGLISILMSEWKAFSAPVMAGTEPCPGAAWPPLTYRELRPWYWLVTPIGH